MSYKQSKNPFKSSPLNHNLRDKRTGQNYNHFHDPKTNSRIYTSDQKVISGSSKFGTQSGRAKNLPYEQGGNMNFDVGQRFSEEDIARDYARQMAEMYNTGELVSGNFLADDLDKRNRKLSFKKGKLKLGSKAKNIDKVRSFGGVRGIANEDGSYTAPETQYTEDQIYDMMVQGGGLVSIVDGKIVSGNPNEIMSQGFDEKNRIRTNSDFNDQYEEGTQEDFEKNQARNNKINDILNMNAEEKKALLQEKREKILAARAEKLQSGEVTEENLSMEERRALLEEKRKKILAARAAQANSPVNNNSPLHQEQEVDPRTGEALEGYDYISGDSTDVITTEEVFGPDGVTVIGTDRITNTTTPQDGTMQQPTPPPTPPDNRPDFKEDCEGIVMNLGLSSKSGYYKCDIDPSPPITTPPAEIETPEDLTHSYDAITTNRVFTPIEPEPPVETPEPEPEPRRNRFVTGGASIYKKPVNWDLTLPQTGPRFDAWLRNLSLTGKKCGNCDYLSR